MKRSLELIAGRIGELLAADDFPDRIEPDYLAAAVRDYPSRGGKRLRPALLLWCCGLLGGDPESACYAAAAVEVNHNWTLVHDDIIDRDAVRRNLPSSHVRLAGLVGDKFQLPEPEAVRAGRDLAILCGDLQQAWANSLLLKSVRHGVAPDTALRLAARLQELGNRDLVSGEALDVELAWRRIEDISPADCIRMIELKTGALLRLAAEAGAMIAGGNDSEVARLGDFAMLCAVAFQLRDDHLGLFGREATLGKAVGSDLRERKPTVLLLRALELTSPEGRRRLLSLLGRESYSEAELAEVRRLVSDCGAAALVDGECRRLAGEASLLLEAFPANEYRRCLRQFADYLIERDR